MKHYISHMAVCPFYKHEDPQVIYCEGVQDGSVIHLAFASRTAAQEYKRTYCRKCYMDCKISSMLGGLYDDGEDR